MKLISFQVTNFRSINDSGIIQVDQITSLVGRNESGKSNLLKALASLNPPGKFSPLNKKKDFPRHKRLSDCQDDTRVLQTVWELSDDDREALQEILPRASEISKVDVYRNYGGLRMVGLNLPPIPYSQIETATRLRKLVPYLEALGDSCTDEKRTGWEAAVSTFQTAATAQKLSTVWALSTAPAIEALNKAFAVADVSLKEPAATMLDELTEIALQIKNDADAQPKARAWIVNNLPVFVLLDEYPNLPGQQNIEAFLSRKNAVPPTLTEADKNFEKLCKVAGLAPEELHKLHTDKDPETRNQLANRAGAVVTAELKRLWKDRPLKVRFNVDAEHFETLISDPTETYDVEVNLDERSRGFQWFFSFYVTFAADTDGGSAENAILLLDEPGLYLHALSQEDLLHHFESDFENQIIYTTHSPFMIAPRSLSSVRTVNMSEDTKTTVTNTPTGDRKTLFPLQSALGYTAAQSLFFGPKNVVVEGVTDFWILSAVSDYLAEKNQSGLDEDIIITPGGGAQRASYMVTLLTAQRLDVVLLLDAESESKKELERLTKEKIIRSENVVFVTDAMQGSIPAEADVEDLLGSTEYIALVKESYAKELSGKTLVINPKLPRVEKQAEDALEQLGIKFNKTRPANLFMRKMASDPAAILSPQAEERFARLFVLLNEKIRKISTSARKPFGQA